MIERFDPADRRDNLAHRVFRDEHRLRYILAARALEGRVPRDGVILDAACGAGYGYRYLSPLGRYIGVDAFPGALERCRERHPEGAFLFTDLDGVWFKFAPHAIVSLETAEHLRDPIGFLRRCYEALAPRRGTLVFSAPTSLTRDYDPYHRHDWTSERWREVLRRSGFTIWSERPMPFTTTFREFLGTVPVTRLQMARVVAYDLIHPRYLIDRIWNWGLRQRFYWESTLWVCVTELSAADR